MGSEKYNKVCLAFNFNTRWSCAASSTTCLSRARLLTYNFAFVVNNLRIHIVNEAKILAIALYQSISIHDNKNFRVHPCNPCAIKIAPFTYLNTANSTQCNVILHLTANFIQKPAIFRSLLDHFSFVLRSSLVVLSFVIR